MLIVLVVVSTIVLPPVKLCCAGGSNVSVGPTYPVPPFTTSTDKILPALPKFAVAEPLPDPLNATVGGTV